jgi:inosose dehydratase
VKVVKDFLPLFRHVHLKDWNGGPHWAENCPLEQGKVDVDPSAKAPLTPIETARVSKEYLQKQGYAFRS